MTKTRGFLRTGSLRKFQGQGNYEFVFKNKKQGLVVFEDIKRGKWIFNKLIFKDIKAEFVDFLGG